MKSKKELAQILGEMDLKDKNLIFSCGSGLTACIIGLAAELAGYDRLSVYDPILFYQNSLLKKVSLLKIIFLSL